MEQSLVCIFAVSDAQRKCNKMEEYAKDNIVPVSTDELRKTKLKLEEIKLVTQTSRYESCFKMRQELDESTHKNIAGKTASNLPFPVIIYGNIGMLSEQSILSRGIPLFW